MFVGTYPVQQLESMTHRRPQATLRSGVGLLMSPFVIGASSLSCSCICLLCRITAPAACSYRRIIGESQALIFLLHHPFGVIMRRIIGISAAVLRIPPLQRSLLGRVSLTRRK
jgi:hypothetical protein